MSLESNSNRPSPEYLSLNLFPISEDAVQDSVTWLNFSIKHPSNFHYEMKIWQNTDPRFSQYLDGMESLKNLFVIPYEQQGMYRTGNLYAYNLLQAQFEIADGTPLPNANPSACNAYFKSMLLPNPDSGTSEDYAILQARLPGLHKRLLSPLDAANLFKSEEPDDTLKRVAVNFRHSSSRKVNELFKEREKSVIEARHAFENLIPEDKMQSFFSGAADVYWPYQMDTVIGLYVAVLDQKEF